MQPMQKQESMHTMPVQLKDIESKPVCFGYMNDKDFNNYVNQQMHFLEQNPEAYKKIMKEVIVW